MSSEVSVIYRVLRFAANLQKVKPYLASSKYLNYDQAFLCSSYSAEESIAEGIAYSECYSWLRESLDESRAALSASRVRMDSEAPFSLSFAKNNHLKIFQSEALEEFNKYQKASENKEIVRLREIEIDSGSLILHVERAEYHDQVQSNLVLDWEAGPPIGPFRSLRSYLQREFGRALPPLHDQRLANTIGISTVILYQQDEEYIPYLVRRVGGGFKRLFSEEGRVGKNVAVSEGGFSTTASSVLPWQEFSSFADGVTDSMYQTLESEVGLGRADVDVLTPVALCREYLRGGKPQIFFLGTTSLTRDELDMRRGQAVEKSLSLGTVQEVHKHLPKYQSIEELEQAIKKEGITLEALANLSYVEPFLAMLESSE